MKHLAGVVLDQIYGRNQKTLADLGRMRQRRSTRPQKLTAACAAKNCKQCTSRHCPCACGHR